MWKEFFPNAQIYGVDFNPECKRHEEDRIEILIASQDDASELDRLAKQAGGFDIVVDDASHINHLTVASFQILIPHLRRRGLYFIEDLGMSWLDYTEHLDDPDFMEGVLKTHVEKGVPIDNRRKDLDTLFRDILFEMDMNRGEILFLHFWSKIAVLMKGVDSR
jgi:hypothetical protein